jgi:hypothetical protein
MFEEPLLSEVKKLLDIPFMKAPPGCTAELLDENDENGPVVIRESCGSIRMMMPRDVYEELLAYKVAEK